MSDDIFGREPHEWSDPDLEARLVALIMGEASAFEEEALTRLMEERPEVVVLKRRLEVVHGLMFNAVKPQHDEEWKLSPERRGKLMEALGIGAAEEDEAEWESDGNGNGNGESAKEIRIRKAGRTMMWAAAACILVNVVLIFFLVGSLKTAGSYSTTGAADGEQRRNVMSPGSEVSLNLESNSRKVDNLMAHESPLPPPSARPGGNSPDIIEEANGGFLSRRADPEPSARPAGPGPKPAAPPITVARRQPAKSEDKPMQELRREIADAQPVPMSATIEPPKPPEPGDRASSALAKLKRNIELPQLAENQKGGDASEPDPFGAPVPPARQPVLQGENSTTGFTTNVELREKPPARKAPIPIAFGSQLNAPGKESEVRPLDLASGDDAGLRSGDATISSGQRIVLPGQPGSGVVAGLSLEDDFADGWGAGAGRGGEPDGSQPRNSRDFVPPDELFVGGGTAGGGGGIGGVALEEGVVAQRFSLTNPAEDLLMEGRKAYAEGNYDEAVEKYQKSLAALPDGFAPDPRRGEIEAHLADGKVAQAQKMRRMGRYNEARDSLADVLAMDPDNEFARRELGYLDEPIRTGQALTYEHAENVDKVRRNLYTAEGYKNLGLYDKAIEEYNKALRIDKYNTAARRGMEQIHKLKSDYYDSAYDETRARLLAQVDAAWEEAVPPAREADARSAPAASEDMAASGVPVVDFKLRNMVIPELNLEDATVDEAIDLLRQRTRELDQFELDPSKKGMNFVIRKPRVDGGLAGLDEELDAEGGLGAVDPGAARIKGLKLQNVTLDEALQAIADQSGMRYRVDDHAITMLPLGAGEGEDLVTRKWKVSPTFLSDLSSADESGEGEPDPFGGDDTGLGGSALKARRPLIEILKDSGIDFPPGATAQYLPGTSTLIVSNTRTNIDLVDRMTESLFESAPPRPIDERLFKRGSGGGRERTKAQELVEFRLNNIILPVVDFDDTTVEEAIDFIRQRARELGHLRAGSEGQGHRVCHPETSPGCRGRGGAGRGAGSGRGSRRSRSGERDREGAQAAERSDRDSVAVYLRTGEVALQDPGGWEGRDPAPGRRGGGGSHHAHVGNPSGPDGRAAESTRLRRARSVWRADDRVREGGGAAGVAGPAPGRYSKGCRH